MARFVVKTDQKVLEGLNATMSRRRQYKHPHGHLFVTHPPVRIGLDLQRGKLVDFVDTNVYVGWCWVPTAAVRGFRTESPTVRRDRERTRFRAPAR